MRKTSDLRQAALADRPLVSSPAPSLFAHPNVYAELLFSKRPRLPHPLSRCPRGRPACRGSLSGSRLQVLSWFRQLTPAQRRNAASVRSLAFLTALAKSLPAYRPSLYFNLQTGKTIEMAGLPCAQDEFFERLVGCLRVAACSEPILFLGEQALEGEALVEWMDRTSNSKLFEYNCDGENNLLWFSAKAFRPLSHALCAEIEKQLMSAFLRRHNCPDDLQELREFMVSSGRTGLLDALDMPLEVYLQKSQRELEKLVERVRIEEDRLHAAKAEQLFLQMDTQAKVRKNRRRHKKKNDSPSPSMLSLQEIPIQQPPEEQDSHPASQPPDPKLEQPLASSESKKDSETDSLELTLTLTPPEPVQQEKEEEGAKECHSDHQPSTNENERSISKSESASHLEETFHHEELPQNSLPVSEEIKEEKARRRRRKRRREESAVEQLRGELRHRFMTRQLEAISESINASTNRLLEARVAAFERIRILLQNNYPFSNAVLFGSNAIGLALPSSDVDILLVGFNCLTRNDSAELLHHFGCLISCMQWAVSCDLYATAKVPVLKLQIDTSVPFLQMKGSVMSGFAPPGQWQGERAATVKVDVTVNVEGVSSGGYESTVLMKKWLEKFPFAQKIVILFKHLLSSRNLNENYRGGIGSYCLFVMVIAYIQEHPKCQENELSRTFVELLEWYSETFDSERQIVWLREEGSSFVAEEVYEQQREEEQRRGLLRLVDPTTGRIMSGSCSEYLKIKQFFREILERLGSIEGMIEEDLRNTSDNHADLARLFQNRRQSEKWFRQAEERHGWALRSLMGLD